MITRQKFGSTNSSNSKSEKRGQFLKILFCNEKLISNGVKIQWLPHPGTGNTAPFIILEKEKCLLEVLQFKPLHRSWIINEAISSDGKCYITVPFDITFFIAYFLRKNCSKQAIPLDHWEETDHPNLINILLNFADKSLIGSIADIKSSNGVIAYKYNKDKCLAWLAIKAKLLSKTLKQKNINFAASATSSNYTKSESLESEEEKEYLEYACGIVGNYISEDMYAELLTYFSLDKEHKGLKRKHYVDMEPLPKKVKKENGAAVDTSKEKEKKVNIKKKAFAKAAIGSKHIASFFKR